MLAVGGGTAITLSGSAAYPIVNNTGVTALGVSGVGIASTATTGSCVLSNTGVTSAVAGTGIGVSASTGAVTFSNSGVTSLGVSGVGLSTSGSTGSCTLQNTGVTSIVAGSNVSISGSTGAVTISASAPSSAVNSVTSAGTGSGIVVGGTSADPTISTALTAGTGISIANGSGNALVISATAGPSALPNVVLPYNFTAGTGGGSYIVGGLLTFTTDGGVTVDTRFTVPAGVWLVQMDAFVDTNSSTSGSSALVFTFQRSSSGNQNAGNLTVNSINDGGFSNTLATGSFYVESAGEQFQIYCTPLGGLWYANGGATVAVKCVYLGPSLATPTSGTPYA